MNDELVVAVTQAPAVEALRLLLADSRSAETRAAYEQDLTDFFRWRGCENPTQEAVVELCSRPSAHLALALNGYKLHLRDRGLAEATINRRLAALRSLLRMARRLGAACPDPAGLVSGEKVKPYRDTRGPAIAEVARLLQAPDRETVRGKRDYALLLLLCENALRRGELHRCDVGDFAPEELRLFIRGKGSGTQKEPVTISSASVAAVAEYLNARGCPAPEEPLFCNLARFSDGTHRLTGRGIYHIVNTYGMRVLRRKLRPHALRHMAITAYLDATGGNLRGAQRLSRHVDLRTLQKYDDNRQDLQGAATNLLSVFLGSRGE